MRGKATIVWSIFAILAITCTAFLFFSNKPCANFNEKTITTPSGSLFVAIAKTSQQQSRGLGGCKYVPKRSGMLFLLNQGPFDTAQGQNATFWMKDMLIPIDIVWIAGSRVLGVEQNVPYPTEQVPDADFPVYSSPGDVDAVLEVGAGKAEEYGLVEGAQVNLDK